MDSSDISVVICTRDRPEVLRACLTSLSHSLSLPGETCVIDQSADEKTRQVVDEFAQNSPLNLRYYRHKGTGHTCARNIGARISRCKIIAYTDDDCTVDESWTSGIIKEFEETKANCVCGQTTAANHTDRPKTALLSTLKHPARRVITNRCNPLMVGRGNNMAFLRSDLIQMGGFNEKIGVGSSVYAGDDADILYRLLKAGGLIVVTPHAVVHHSQPDGWSMVIKKKRGYAISFAAVFAIRAVQGDTYAGALVSGKLLYEAAYLLLWGALTLRGHMAQIGWHSLMGSLSGLKYVFDPGFSEEIRRLTVAECEVALSKTTINIPS